MSSLYDALSEELFQILKGSGKTLSLYGPDGNKTYEPSKARRVFAQPDNIMLSVIEAGSDSDVRLYLSQSTDIEAISKLIDTLRMVTTRYNVLFNVRKFGRELSPKDFAYQTVNVAGAAMYGSTRTSYQRIGDAKMIVKHLAPIKEEVFGSRSRNILAIFVETIEGERFKFPSNYLAGGRAFARHIDLGGKPHDVIGTQISELAFEATELGRVGRYVMHSRRHLGEDAQTLRVPIRSRILEIRKAFASLTGPKGYQKMIEAGLPLQTTNLNEDNSMGNEIARLMELLGIDSNHALAESLTPVALLTMGENMTTINEMFHGVIALDEAIANELIEALISEFGYDTDTWTQMGESVGFFDAAVFEDAQRFLDLNESAYALHEDDQFQTFARQYMDSRHRDSGEKGEADGAAVTELADGIKAIFNGGYKIPDVGDEYFRFRGGATDDYILSMYVEQHIFNTATGNFLSAIIAKAETNTQLMSAEKVVKNKLVKAFKDDMDPGMEESIVDEGMWDRRANSTDENLIQDTVQNYEDNFDPETFLATQGYEDFLASSDMHPDDKASPTEAKYFIGGISHCIVKAVEDVDQSIDEMSHMVQVTAAHLFKDVLKPYLEQHGFAIDESLEEFAAMDEKPEHHGIADGDKVSTDLGYGQVISVEGDIAHIEFLNGQVKSMHVDDMDKVEGLGESTEERELSEWFDSLMPESVLDLNELSIDRKHRYFNDAAKDRGKLEKKADQGDDAAAKKLSRRDAGLKMAFNKMRETMVSEGMKLPEGVLDDIFADLKEIASDALINPAQFGIEQPVGQDDTDEENMNFMNALSTLLSDELKTRLQELSLSDMEVTYDESLGGDQGEDMINDVSVHNKDQDLDEEELDERARDVFTGMDNEMLQRKLLSVRNNPKYADYRMELRKELMRRKEEGIDEADEDNGLENTGEGETCPHCGEPDCHGECYDPEKQDVEEEQGFDEAAQKELQALLKNAMFRR